MTGLFTDTHSLRAEQYKDSSRLSARADLHQRFSTNPIEWHQWVFNQFGFSNEPVILEVGSGPGHLWKQNRKRLKQADIFLSDISTGMLEEARAELVRLKVFSFTACDARFLPFRESLFDAVIANHMLYHIPDVPAALKEISRVLKTGGCLYATTNGNSHLKEIRSWRARFFPGQESSDWGTSVLGFSIENGEQLLRQAFRDIRFSSYEDSLKVDKVDPILRYIESYAALDENKPGSEKFRKYLQEQIAENGSIKITKESGIFTAVKH